MSSKVSRNIYFGTVIDENRFAESDVFVCFNLNLLLNSNIGKIPLQLKILNRLRSQVLSGPVNADLQCTSDIFHPKH